MKIFRTILPILLSTIWISASEFVRNQVIFRDIWETHYHDLGLVFPERLINGAGWGLWSLVFAIVIYIISRKFSLIQTALISWVAAFAMMWLVIGNLHVLPWSLLPFAIPLSLLEVFVAAWISRSFPNGIQV